MSHVGAFDAKTRLAALLERAEKGETITITKHGRPVARLVPANAPSHDERRRVIERMKEFGKGQTLGKFGWKQLRDSGRK